MTNNAPLNENILLDRLVDGELSGSDRRQLLESFDKHPEAWRRCALAFLEAQSWREDMGQLAHGLASKTNEPKLPASSVTTSRRLHWSSVATWIALAASLLLAFGLGWMQHQRGLSVAGGSPDSGRQVATVAPTSSPVPTNGTKSANAVTLFVQSEDGRRHPVRVPLVDAGTLDKQLGVQFQTGVPEDIRNQLKDSGYAVKSKRQYAKLWLENGRPMILPVEDTQIVPVSNRVY